MKRRTIIAGAGALGAASGPKKPTSYLVHHAIFWLKNPTSETDRNKLIEGLNTLRAIEHIQELHVGVLASTEKRDVVDSRSPHSSGIC